MDCQPWLQQRIEKYRAFFADDAPGRIMVNLALWEMDLDDSDLGVPERPLNSWDFETEAEAFADYVVRRRRAVIELARSAEDDRIPYVSPFIGVALNSAYCSDAEIKIDPDTTWTDPVVSHWDDLERLRLDPENRWARFISRLNRRFVGLSDGDYAVQTFPHYGPMDMANALRGNDLFTDFHDAPEQVQALMRYCADAIQWLEREQRRIVPMTMGGSVIWGTWVPGRAIFMSEDVNDLSSAAVYAEFGQPYTAQIAAAMGGAWLHHHAKGLHLHQAIADSPDLRLLEISRDPNCERPIDHLPELFEWNNGLPLMTKCDVADVYAKIDQMKQGRLILQLSAATLDEAREAIAFVRRHSRL